MLDSATQLLHDSPVVDDPKSCRTATRYPCNLDAICWPSLCSVKEKRASVRIRDISTGGIGLLFTEPVEPGTVLTLELQNAERTVTRTVLARAVHVRPVGQGEWALGCTFLSRLEEDEVMALSTWFPRLLEEDGESLELNGHASVLMTPLPQLTRKQKEAVVALCDHETIDAAAAAAKIKSQTLRRWLGLEEFQIAFRSARMQKLEGEMGRLHQLAGRAISVLERHLNCGQPAVEVQAAIGILEHASKAFQLVDTEPRLRTPAPTKPKASRNGTATAVPD